MNRPEEVGLDLLAAIDRFADDVNKTAQRVRTHRHGDRRAGIGRLHAAHKAVGRIHRHSADAVLAQMLLDLADQFFVQAVGTLASNADRIENTGQPATRKIHVNHRPNDLNDFALIHAVNSYCLTGETLTS